MGKHWGLTTALAGVAALLVLVPSPEPVAESRGIQRVIAFGDSLMDCGTFGHIYATNPGRTYPQEIADAYGIELGSIRERFDRFEEACEVLTSLLSKETTTFDGKFYQLKDARNEPKGPQQPHPPICIGGSGEKRTLKITARYAQHWNFVGGTPEEFARKRDVLAAHCADVGRDPKEITLSAHVRLGEDRNYRGVIEDCIALGAEGLDLAIIYLPPHVLSSPQAGKPHQDSATTAV